jgi:hypothetical protein
VIENVCLKHIGKGVAVVTVLLRSHTVSGGITVIMQRYQSKILMTIANAPRDVTNYTPHTDFNIDYVSEGMRERISKHQNNLEGHPNSLLRPLLQPTNTSRLTCSHLMTYIYIYIYIYIYMSYRTANL